MKWITRECPKIDHIACPWMVARFIDEAPEFLYASDDHGMLKHGLAIYDALYARCSDTPLQKAARFVGLM